MVFHEQIRPESLAWVQQCLRTGAFTLSEHVIRFILFGKITMAVIEQAVLTGSIVEVRINRKRQESWLIRGNVKDQKVKVLCTKDTNGQMVILLVLWSGPLTWAEIGWIETQRGEDMSDSIGQCYFCGGTIKPVIVGNFDYRLEGRLYVVKNVPAGLCLDCGEKYVSSETAEKINALVGAGQFNGTESVHVIAFDG